MRPARYRMNHPNIVCRGCLDLDGRIVPPAARDWLKPEAGHAMMLTTQGRSPACQIEKYTPRPQPRGQRMRAR